MDPFNPLDKTNLGKSVGEALLSRDLVPLSSLGSRGQFPGAGVYAIYYSGERLPFLPDQALIDHNRRANSHDLWPIYVGKAIPKGARTAGVGVGAAVGTALFSRLQHHARSIEAATNLDGNDFLCRYLMVDDIWIPLGESLLIHSFKPVWNVLLDGFGNNAPGSGRRDQRRSAWDTVHPGRLWANQLASPNEHPAADLEDLIVKFLAGENVPTKSVIEAIESEND